MKGRGNGGVREWDREERGRDREVGGDEGRKEKGRGGNRGNNSEQMIGKKRYFEFCQRQRLHHF